MNIEFNTEVVAALIMSIPDVEVQQKWKSSRWKFRSISVQFRLSYKNPDLFWIFRRFEDF